MDGNEHTYHIHLGLNACYRSKVLDSGIAVSCIWLCRFWYHSLLWNTSFQGGRGTLCTLSNVCTQITGPKSCCTGYCTDSSFIHLARAVWFPDDPVFFGACVKDSLPRTSHFPKMQSGLSRAKAGREVGWESGLNLTKLQIFNQCPRWVEPLVFSRHITCSSVSNLSFFFPNPGVEWQEAQQGDQRPGTILLLFSAAWQLCCWVYLSD